MELYADQLVIEMTRRCNLRCDHCLRGNAQDISISQDVLDAIFEQLDGFNSVVFTGGEPAYEYRAIDRFLDECKRRKQFPQYFWLATNGLVNQLELATVLLKYYPLAGDPDLVGVAVSSDEFHGSPVPDSENYLKGLSFYDEDAKRVRPGTTGWVLDRGRASETGVGERDKPVQDRPYVDDMETDDVGKPTRVVLEQVYVAANGKVVWDCDLSYEQIDASGVPLDGLRDHVEAYLANRASTR